MSVEIIASVFGVISDPVAWPEFSCIRKNIFGLPYSGAGRLHKRKWRNFCRTFKKDGATGTREITFLLPETDIEFNRKYLPYKFVNGKYDLEQPNKRYYKNLKLLAKNARERSGLKYWWYKLTGKKDEGLKFYISLFDRCHGKYEHSPWRNNHQGIDSFYDLPEHILYKHLENVINAIGQYDPGYELVNEPMDARFPDFAVKIIEYLKINLVSNRNIIQGLEFLPPENYRFRKFKKACRDAEKENPEAGLFYDKKNQFATVHNVDKQNFIGLYPHTQKHSKRWWVSDDGEGPKKNEEWWFDNLDWFFSHRKLGINQAFINHWVFEHLYRFPQDDIHGVRGIARAVNKKLKEE